MGEQKAVKYGEKRNCIWFNGHPAAGIPVVGILLLGVLLTSILAIAICYLLQRYAAHQEDYFVPEYARITLMEETDYETIFLQTGLGRPAVDKLLGEVDVLLGEEDNMLTPVALAEILEIQEIFFRPQEIECLPLLGWFTREDRLQNDILPEFVDLQPGDILLTLSTHSLGWRHGHAALVLDENTTLESRVLGEESCYGSTESWRSYSNFAVMRVKNISREERGQVAEYGKEVLYGVPYRLSAGFIGGKDMEQSEWYFGVHCSYLVWYAWNHFGYDLDSDKGRLVTTYDLLHSELLEVVQIYGMEPGSLSLPIGGV